MDLGLKGKRALVTGASRGLGFAVARLLAQEGCAVAINSRNYKALEDAADQIRQASNNKVTVVPFSGDLTDPSMPQSVVTKAADALKGLDILVTNTAGPPAGAFEKIDEGQWTDAIDMVFLAHVRLVRAALPFLRQSPSPSVLAITSYAVKQPIDKLVLSNSIRAATASLMKSLALELGEESIRFNAILPGWTKTERVTELLEKRAEANGTDINTEIKKQTREIALKRMAEPEEFAKAAVFLVSPAAAYITGAMLNVDGGAYKGTW